MGTLDSLETFELRNMGFAKGAKYAIVPNHLAGANGTGREKNGGGNTILPQYRERVKVVVAVTIVERDHNSIVGNVIASEPFNRFFKRARETAFRQVLHVLFE